MKKLAFSFILAFTFLFSLGPNADAQNFGKKKPLKPEKIEEVIPERLSPNHEWVEGRWKWKRKEKKYIWMEGYWNLPRNRDYGSLYYGPYYRPYYGSRYGFGYRYGYGHGYGYSRRFSHHYHYY